MKEVQQQKNKNRKRNIFLWTLVPTVTVPTIAISAIAIEKSNRASKTSYAPLNEREKSAMIEEEVTHVYESNPDIQQQVPKYKFVEGIVAKTEDMKEVSRIWLRKFIRKELDDMVVDIYRELEAANTSAINKSKDSEMKKLMAIYDQKWNEANLIQETKLLEGLNLENVPSWILDFDFENPETRKSPENIYHELQLVNLIERLDTWIQNAIVYNLAVEKTNQLALNQAWDAYQKSWEEAKAITKAELDIHIDDQVDQITENDRWEDFTFTKLDQASANDLSTIISEKDKLDKWVVRALSHNWYVQDQNTKFEERRNEVYNLYLSKFDAAASMNRADNLLQTEELEIENPYPWNEFNLEKIAWKDFADIDAIKMEIEKVDAWLENAIRYNGEIHNAVFRKRLETPIYHRDGAIVIPAGVTEIPAKAFSAIKANHKVIIPHTVRKIGDQAFSHADLRQGIVFPVNLKEIGHEAFFGARVANDFQLPEKIEKWGSSAFYRVILPVGFKLPRNMNKSPEYSFKENLYETQEVFRAWVDEETNEIEHEPLRSKKLVIEEFLHRA